MMYYAIMKRNWNDDGKVKFNDYFYLRGRLSLLRRASQGPKVAIMLRGLIPEGPEVNEFGNFICGICSNEDQVVQNKHRRTVNQEYRLQKII